MNEDQWLQSSSPKRMLDHIPYRVSKRKWRLVAVAVCRRIWHPLADVRSRHAVEAAEQWADGLLSLKDLKTASQAALPYGIGLAGAPKDAGYAASAASSATSVSKQDTFRTAWLVNAAMEVAGGVV